MLRKLAALALVALPLLAWPTPAAAASASAGTGPLYAVTRSQNLVTVDLATGSFTVLSNLFTTGAFDSQTTELVSDPAAGKLYADRLSFLDSSYSVFNEELLTIDAATGAVVNAVAGHFTGLLVDQSTGALYGFDNINVLRINPSTGATTTVATIGDDVGSYIWSLDVDPNTHTIYASREDVSGSDNTTRLFTVGTTSGAVTSGPVLAQYVRQIVVDPASGQLFGVADSRTHDLVRIDPGTGATNLVATIVPSADPYMNMQFGMAADGASHTVFGDVQTYDTIANTVTDQLVSIQDQTGAIGISAALAGSIVTCGLAFAGPAPTIPAKRSRQAFTTPSPHGRSPRPAASPADWSSTAPRPRISAAGARL